ncbi:arsenosugar biosynthesis radical SAM (seleno)protein ArsS [Pseudogulbenkiania subflava]|uniref:Radical SAM/Cys-rich domain-containing protein n=1 Tax=Pseudogulbenkiania subflava DSM 22618 TaxID=1123014 RepID=A0A1Y6C228_9NEIS|nr:arsenosugar biosynthesis radical SAM (seleno)protein ArsS [Pseudogulbenkiania subflava]SMF23298.1 radical SAM/Cys-rich domain-containing protein [Pseudogulbenkiania subflava DSM 22618]SMF32658.1 radical SAM/Cys-rich domain-containing protein [Pseudogulbenkiania subflava DSM 22618]SMF47697.1 radical SAM/Cys-rich domain-containing protein [Pseudogulbenkiania subflava DSM 22618]
MHATLPLLQKTDFPAIRRTTLDTLQVNLGYKCNQTCVHCHVNAGPNRTEMMNRDTVELVLAVLKARRLTTLDLTGGAPELNPHFRDLVRHARALGVKVIDRCNLTILFEPGQEDLADFLAREQVEVVASMPCYEKDNVDRQRGNGVFDKSIAALQELNARGYARPGSGLALNLVYNPQGPVLPPDQSKLQAAYRHELSEHFGILFNQLFVLANMPIQRFGSTLVSKGQFAGYMQLLRDHYCPANLDNVMCRRLISVDWQGFLYDCDFNQMLHLPMKWHGVPHPHLLDLLGQDLVGQPIVVADHCYGCTAGQGSSCGGALENREHVG